jgi:hypothetical protein
MGIQLQATIVGSIAGGISTFVRENKSIKYSKSGNKCVFIYCNIRQNLAGFFFCEGASRTN